uniref:Uncharacterized protein n=1 Tax=Arundo donax TaxID=35708 RepID=A0A0A8YX02_ARUDO
MEAYSQSTRANRLNNKIQNTVESTRDEAQSTGNSMVGCNPSTYHPCYLENCSLAPHL